MRNIKGNSSSNGESEGTKTLYGSLPISTSSNVTTNINSENDDHHCSGGFVCYPQRWIVLLAFSLLSFGNSWIWITWSPITSDIATFWSVSTSYVDELSAVYMYVYIPFNFPALHFLHNYKLRWGLIAGATINFVGSFLRYWCGTYSYTWVYIGTVLCALCQTLTLAMPPLISTLWFPETERGLATSLGVLANQLGVAFGLGATILVDLSSTNSSNADTEIESEERFININNLNSYLRLQMIISGLSLVLILYFIRSNAPPTAPSEAAFSQKETSYIESICLLIKTLSGSMLCFVYGLVVGVFYAITTLLSRFFLYNNDENETNNDWSEKEVGYLGMVLIMTGLSGSLLAGEYLDKTHSYRGITIALLLGALVSMISFLLGLEFLPWNRYLAYTSISFLGFFLTGLMSAGFEYGTAISYPADEAAVAGIMNVAAQIGGWVLVEIGDDVLGGSSSSLVLNSLLTGTLFIATIFMVILVRAKSKRPS